MVGGSVFIGLFLSWSDSGAFAMLLNVSVALLAALCLAGTTWAILLFWIAPLFASPETRRIQNSVKMTGFDPFRLVLEISIANDTAAELTARENLPTLITEQAGLRRYRISAHLLDYDIRYGNTIKTQVLLDHCPADKEAGELLQPVIDCVMVQQMGENTFYELDSIEVEEIHR